MDGILVVHVFGGVALLATGVVAALAPKRRRSTHPRVGRVYVVLLVVVLVTGMVVGARRPGLTPFEIATPPTLTMGLVGFLAARRPLRHRLGGAWKRWHISGMGGSLIGVVTASALQVVPRLVGASPVTLVLTGVVPTVVGSAVIARVVTREVAAAPPTPPPPATSIAPPAAAPTASASPAPVASASPAPPAVERPARR